MFKIVPDHFVWLIFFAVDHIYGINMEQLQLALGKVQDVLYKKSNWLEWILDKNHQGCI